MVDFNGQKVEEAKNFEETCTALNRSGFTYDEIENIVDVIIAILFLGNVELVGNDSEGL